MTDPIYYILAIALLVLGFVLAKDVHDHYPF